MPNNFPYFPFYGADFTMSTARWPADAVGAYVRLLIHQWDHGGIPIDEEELAELCGLDEVRFSRLWMTKLQSKFIVNGDGLLVNERLRLERRKVEETRDRRSEAGRRGGRPRSK